MRRQYDDFTQLKIKDMSKVISDMTYKYINEESNFNMAIKINSRKEENNKIYFNLYKE